MSKLPKYVYQVNILVYKYLNVYIAKFHKIGKKATRIYLTIEALIQAPIF